ncbi:MAG: AAA family ATPase [Parvibaculum sp.]|nr:AAA family ATPase [Parvibaculum sp.]
MTNPTTYPMSSRPFAEDAKSCGFTSLPEVLGREFPVDLIWDLFPQVGTACLFGAPGTGKSFVAFNIVMSVAAGLDVLGRRSLQGMTVYLSTEGKSGLKARAMAWAEARGTDISDLPVALIEQPMNLREKETVAKLIDRIKQLEAASGIPCRFICVDTLSQCLFGDENRQEDMAEFTGAMTRIANALTTQVCVVHHSGKDKSKGARGSSVISGNFDTLLALEEDSDEGQFVLRTDKQKNGGKAAVSIKFEMVECGEDGDGEPVYSLVVSGGSGEPVDIGNGSQPVSRSLTPNGKKVLEVLRAAGPDGLELGEWRKRVRTAGIGSGRDATANEWTKKLVERDFVEVRPDGKHVAK